MEKQTILMVLNTNNFPPDIRVEKEIRALQSDFNLKVLICSKDQTQASHYESAEILHWVDKKSRLKNIINGLQFAVFQRSFLWEKAMKRAMDTYPISAIHVHDLPLSKSAYYASKKTNTKLVLDFHENFPEGIRVWNQWNNRWRSKLRQFISGRYKKWLRYERWAIHHADHVIAVVKEMKQRLQDIHKVEDKKVTVVSNTEEKRFLDQKAVWEHADLYKEDFICSYIGGFGPHRGLDVAIKAMTYLKEQPNIKFLLVGDGSPETNQYLSDLIKHNQLEKQVIQYGWQHFSVVKSMMESSDIGIIPHQSNSHTDNTIPHKLFQYMMLQKPVITSSCPSMESVITETKAGCVFTAGDPQALAREIKTLYDDSDLYKTCAENAKRATHNGLYSWERDGQYLVNMYTSLTNK